MKDLQTARLYLRKITIGDASFILKLLNSKGWIDFIGDRNVSSLLDAEEYINEHYISSYKTNGYGSYLVLLRDKNEPIGVCGLYKRSNLDYPDIGFAMLKEFTNTGYAFESAKTVLDYAIKELKIEKVLGFTVKHNLASINLLKKLGLKKKGFYSYELSEENMLLYST